MRRFNFLSRVLLLLPLAVTAAMAGTFPAGDYPLEALFQNGLSLPGFGLNLPLVQFLGTSDVNVDGSGNATVTIAATEIDGIAAGTLTATGTGTITDGGGGTYSSFFDVFFDITLPGIGDLTNRNGTPGANALLVSTTLPGPTFAVGTTFTETPLPINIFLNGSLAGQLLQGISDGNPVADKTIVPEPGTWTMMAGGLILAGGFARRRVIR